MRREEEKFQTSQITFGLLDSCRLLVNPFMCGMMHCMAHALKHRHLLLAALLAALMLFELFALKAFTPLENRMADFLLRQHAQTSQPDPDIVIVDIDERSLALMSESVGRWPWPRSMHAELLAGIARQNPKAIVFDILFSDPDRMRPEDDAYFAETIRATDNTYFPMLRLNDADDAQGIPLQKYGTVLGAVPGKQADPDARVAMVLPLPVMLETGRIGTHNALADEDGVVRRYPIYISIDGWHIPSLPAAFARNQDWRVPDRASIILSWHGQALSYPRVSYADIYQDLQRRHPQRPQNEFVGKIVIIGATANGLHDVRPTPLAAFHTGVEILATAIDNLKNGDALRPAPTGWVAAMGLTVLALLAGLLGAFRSLPRVGMALLAMTLLLLAAEYLALRSDILLPLLTVVIFAWVYYVMAALMEYISERRARERAVAAFGRFLDPRVVQMLVESGETTQTLSGKSREISVLFSDIRGFTALSETRSPERVVELLNAYFTSQSDVIFRHAGTLDKYIGDAIMAFWNAPVDQPDHVIRAVAAALEMSDRLERFRAQAGELGQALDIGIGVHCGSAVVGFIGSENRQDYTAIGDTVNLSSRIEGLTKGVARVLVSAETKDLCEQQSGGNCPFVFVDRGSFAVKGRAQPVRLYEPRRKT